MSETKQTVTVDDTVIFTSKLQDLIDSVGDTPTIYDFKTPKITIDELIRWENDTEFSCNGCQFKLMDNAPVNPFGVHDAFFAPKSLKAAENISFHDAAIDGNRYNQKKVPLWYGHDGKGPGVQYGQGYHDIIGLGSLKSIAYSNAKNCEFYNLKITKNLGDWLRPEGATNVIAHDISGDLCGHDGINYSCVNGGDIYNISSVLSVGAAVRLRSCKDIKIYGCNISNKDRLTYGPGIQIQATAKNWPSGNIEVFENQVFDTFGPAIQVIGAYAGNTLITIRNNIFARCGAMPGSVNRPTVGGVVFAGYPVNIYNNTINECYGYGFVAGYYDVTSTVKGLTAVIKNNVITKTQKALKQGLYSGTGIADLTNGQYKITVDGNCQYGNKANHYKVTFTNSLSKDPLFIDPANDDYHLQEESPCYFKDLGFEYGAYNGVSYHKPDYSKWPAVVISYENEEMLSAYVRLLYDVGALHSEDIVSFVNVSKGFTNNNEDDTDV